MPRMLENKLSEFIRVFQKPSQAEGCSGTQQEKKLDTLRLFLKSHYSPLTFDQCLGLYKIVLEQDKAFVFRPKKNWHKQEVQVLIFMLSEFYLSDTLDIELIEETMWERLSIFFNGRSSDDCKFKWMSISKHPVNSSVWDQDQQSLLRDILQQVDYENQRPRWNKIARLFNKRSHRNSQVYRSSKELKRKWVSNICKIEKGLWRKEQDLILFESVLQYGKKWSYISKLMKEMRTENGVKNRFLSVIDKEISYCMSKKNIPASEELLVNRIIKRLRQQVSNFNEKNSEEMRQQLDNSPKTKGQQQPINSQLNSMNILENNMRSDQPLLPIQLYHPNIAMNPIYYPWLSQQGQGSVMMPIMLNWNMYGQVLSTTAPNQFQINFN